MRIAFLIGSVDVGGGNYVVCQHAMHAAAMGHEVAVVVQTSFTKAQLAWHPGFEQLRLIPLDQLRSERFDIAVATFWKTGSELHRLNAGQYVYFVQSIESRFYPAEQVHMRRLVDRTYDLRLPSITEATWIREHLRHFHGSECLLARNGIRKDVYTPHGERHAPRISGRLRVMVEGSFGVPFKNTARTVRLVRRARPWQSWLLTTTGMSWYPGVDRVFSQLPIAEVPKVYRSCDVIVKLSFVEGMFGPPMEMFHCGGTAIVYDVSGHDEYIVHGHNALVAPMHNEATVLDHLRRLQDSPRLLEDLKSGATETASKWPDWPQSSARFFEHLEACYAAPKVSRQWLEEATRELREYFQAQSQSATFVKEGHRRVGWLRRLKNDTRVYSSLLRYIADGYR